jgi:hypothetical protein
VLIAAFRGKDAISASAMEVLDDPDRDILVSDFLRLEVLPKPIYQGNLEEVAFYEAVLNAAVENLGWREEVTEQAMELATRYGLSAIDAIHVSAALLGAADEFVTAEKPTKPFFRVREMPVISIRTL